MGTTRAVLFDLDDTLIADDAATKAAFLATCSCALSRYGLDPPALARAVRWQARRLWQAAPTIGYCRDVGISSSEGLRARFTGDDPRLTTLRAWAPVYRRGAWSRALADHGIDDVAFAEELAATFIAERGARHLVFPDVEPVLGALTHTHRLALVTNGAPDLQRAKLSGAGLGPYFDAVIVSGEVGAGKPDPAPFTLALNALGADPAEAVMVGDSLERDIAGARNAGIRAIWLDRAAAERPPDGGVPDERIGDLRQLLAVL